MIWFVYLAFFAIVTSFFYGIGDRGMFKFSLGFTGLFVVGSILIGVTNYIQLGRVFL
ncbi:hypothetical protein AAY80_058 [Stenotrophomonas phage vB_SmaS-DLP_6]|nr:hypothetical protein AAY80_058 [Stenotrophomonas phage vB_SmaS-DLP_6]